MVKEGQLLIAAPLKFSLSGNFRTKIQHFGLKIHSGGNIDIASTNRISFVGNFQLCRKKLQLPVASTFFTHDAVIIVQRTATMTFGEGRKLL